MDVMELLSGTDFEGTTPADLFTWACGRADELIAELSPDTELAKLLPARSRGAAWGSRESANEDAAMDLDATSADDDIEFIDDDAEVEFIAEDESASPAPRREDSDEHASVVVMPPAPPSRESRQAQAETDEYDSPVLERARDALEFGIPDAAPEEREEAEERLFSPEERESIGFAIDDALNAAIVEDISPEESWKLPMELQDTTGFRKIAHVPEVSYSEPARDPGSSGNFERGIPDESGTYTIEDAANEHSGPLRAAMGARGHDED